MRAPAGALLLSKIILRSIQGIMQRVSKVSEFPFARFHWRGLGLLALLALYVAYIAFIVANGQASVDFHTFISIGQRFLEDDEVYIENSYYPLPYVLVFAALAALPSSIAMIVWHAVPLIAALWAARWHLWPLAFAPVFAHFVGAQTAVVGLLAVYGYARWRDNWRGGAMLAIAMLKPQLALLPLAWAGAHWLKAVYHEHTLPKQAWAFGLVIALLYLPTFAIYPGWIADWLASPRPFFERAMAGLIPRTLVILFGNSGLTWGLTVTAVVVFGIVAWHWRFTFEQFMFAGLVMNPFIHDYDLIQMVPLLNTPRLRTVALLAAVPTWLVILLAYGNDRAWYVVTLIPLLTALASFTRRADSTATGEPRE